MLWLAT